MLLLINSLSRGYSGVRPETVALLLKIFNSPCPYIPAKGSLGASGDLAPLAHLALVLIGEGKAFSATACSPARKVLKKSAAGRCGPDRKRDWL